MYCRISSDRAGAGLGVSRQQADCEALAGRLGWTVARVFIDNDRSAYSGRVRPAYEEMLAALEAGEFGALLAWHPDRLHRSPVELERFIDVVERAGVQVATCQAGELDLSSPAGRMTARVVGAVARHESEHKAARLRRKHLELARAGKVSGGGRRAFGYRNVLTDAGHIERVEVVPEEAQLIRQAADRLLAGESLRGVVVSWRDGGVPTVTGAPWSSTTVRRLMTSARIAGRRTHRGEDSGEAVWPAIVGYDELLRIRALLADRAARPAVVARRYLLSGLVACGRCEVRMGSRPTARGVRRYVCTADRGGCDRCGISAEPLEELLSDAALRVLDTPAMAKAMRPKRGDDRAVSDLVDIDARLEELAALWADGGLSVREWSAARDALTKRRDAAQERLASAAVRGAAHELVNSGRALREAWPGLGFEQRRAVLMAVVESVQIAPTTRGNNRFDPDRVDVVWRF